MDFTPQQENRITLYFRLSVFLKGGISLVEIVAGILALFIPVSTVTDFLVHLAQGELAEEPADFIAGQLLHFAQQFSLASSTFIAMYLLSRGAIKLALVIALLKNQLWAYPSSLVVLGLFVVYQIYQIVVTHSPFIIALTMFDLVVMWFIWREYEVLREKAS